MTWKPEEGMTEKQIEKELNRIAEAIKTASDSDQVFNVIIDFGI